MEPLESYILLTVQEDPDIGGRLGAFMARIVERANKAKENTAKQRDQKEQAKARLPSKTRTDPSGLRGTG